MEQPPLSLRLDDDQMLGVRSAPFRPVHAHAPPTTRGAAVALAETGEYSSMPREMEVAHLRGGGGGKDGGGQG